MTKIEKIVDGIVYAGIGAALVISGSVLGKAIIDHAKPKPDELSETVYIVYTDEYSHPYAVLTNPRILEPSYSKIAFTAQERDVAARIVAGQAVGNSTTCQTMIANVLYNQILVNGGKIDGTEYSRCSRQEPTAQTYEAVDAIFTRGEFLLDDTVLWTGDESNPDEWHQTLRFVTSCDGIAFYEAK